MRILLIFLVAGGVLSAAVPPTRCAVCTSPLGSSYSVLTSPALAETQAVCQACARLPNFCAECKLPVRATDRRLEDGRWLCERDARSGVFDAREAERIYEEVRRDLNGLLAGFGVFPDRNISIALVSGTEIKKQHQMLPTLHDASKTLGLTRTEIVNGRQFRHRISLIEGLGRARLGAVAAHEYTHAWMHENVPESRQLDRDTVEGFCELVAYKLMVQRRDETQKKIILANAYSRGQVNAFVDAQNKHQFHRVVNWIKTGADDVLAATNTSRVLVMQPDDEPAAPVWPPPAALPTRVPAKLTLKGISGAVSRRFALINDATLARNEEARVRVGATNVLVRCLDIRDKSVLIQVRGEVAPKELFLTSND